MKYQCKISDFPQKLPSLRVLTLIGVGFLEVRVEVQGGWGGGKATPCLKLVRIKLETSNLARKYILTP